MKKWVWIDLELTGLDVKKDQILEIAVIITDNKCENPQEGPVIVIKAEDDILRLMDSYVKKMHKTSGLTKKVRESLISLDDAENTVLDFLLKNNIEDAPLAGNSVHMDRMFLIRLMPKLFQNCISPKRIIDVSSVKEIYLVYIDNKETIKKAGMHRSLDDILESIAELKSYLWMFSNFAIEEN
ncbi:hypothetical protein SteCoe_33446 [Stentor coeruleus]|uniref:Exonuclease domain-containing protein n=1 Tax=Stentor coeruleus TaxID=5963 RepID=A0A1R2AWR1_9CILI|nr:hypothetical protein SteCoe_33446 [Stentor coeruleus]